MRIKRIDIHMLISAMVGIVGLDKAEKILEHYGELMIELKKKEKKDD